MKKENPHIGSSFENWLAEKGIREGVTAAPMRRRFRTADLTDVEAERIARSRMDPRHASLNKLENGEETGFRRPKLRPFYFSSDESENTA